MSESIILHAKRRLQVGKRSSRLMRHHGYLPAVIYGNHQPVQWVSVELRAFLALLSHKRFFIQSIDLRVDDVSHHVLPREVQFSPLSDIPIHADFLSIADHMRIIVNIPCEFINHEYCPGLKRGGLLNVVRHSIKVKCLATQIPQAITVDLSGFNITESIHVSKVQLPQNVEPTITNRDFTIATIAPPSGR